MDLNEPIKVEGSLSSPRIILDYDNQVFEFSGRCMPENIHEFFRPIITWFEEFGRNPKPNSVFRFTLDYFNTASSKIFVKMLKILRDIDDPTIYAEWNYKVYDEDVREVGEDLIDIVGDRVIRLKENKEG